MATRIVEWQLPYTAWDWIEITANKVVQLLLRDENNLIKINDENEVYVDLQLADWILPTDTFPVWITVWRVLSWDGWYMSWTLLNFKTTSWDYGRWIYGTDWHIYYDTGTWVWQQIYTWPEVDALFTQLRGELANVAFSWDYNDLINRPNIPVIWDGTLTISQNGTSKWTFTANQQTASNIELTDTTYPAMTAWELGTWTDTTQRTISAKVLTDYVKWINALANYYLKTETYTQAEVNALIGAISQFHYEIYASLQDVTTPANNVLYLIWPSGTGWDQYEEYVYSNWFVKIWDTSIDLSWYATTTALTNWLATKQNTLTFDNTPTSWSSNPVTSDGIYQAIGAVDTWVTSVSVNWGTPQTWVVNLSIPDSTSDLTNDSWFITNSVNNLTNYTKTTDLATVATSGSYNDLSNKPTIPTVNDATLTISQWWTSKGTFTANSSTNASVDLNTSFIKTQAEYDNLPATKTSDWNFYFIYSS